MTKKIGSDAKVTKDLLLKAATREFAEKGYDKASLRSICKLAGVTTGALYNLFTSKEDLFNEVVDEISRPLILMMKEHFQREKEAEDFFTSDRIQDDLETFKAILQLYYARQESFRIILQENTHPKIQSFFDELTDILDEQIETLVAKMQVDRMSPFFVHWISHLVIDSVLHIIAHHNTYEEAAASAPDVVNFLRGGTVTFLQSKG